MSSAQVRLDTLRASFSDLATQLKTALKNLDDSGLPPGPDLEQAIAQARQDLEHLATTLGFSADTPALSIQTLEHALNNEALQTAQKLIAKIERLRPTTEINEPKLHLEQLYQLLTAARKQCKTPASLDDKAFKAQVLEPLSQVVTLLEDLNTLDLTTLESLDNALRQNLGRALSLALATRRLELGPEGTTYLDDLFAPAPPSPSPQKDEPGTAPKKAPPSKPEPPSPGSIYIPTFNQPPPSFLKELAPPRQNSPLNTTEVPTAQSPIATEILRPQSNPPTTTPPAKPLDRSTEPSPAASSKKAQPKPQPQSNPQGATLKPEAAAVAVAAPVKAAPKATRPAPPKHPKAPPRLTDSYQDFELYPGLLSIHRHRPYRDLVDELFEYEAQAGELPTDAIAWRLLHDEEEIFALHIALGSDRRPRILEPRILRIAIIGTKIAKNYGPAIDTIREDLREYNAKEWFFPDSPQINRGLRLLLAAGCLIPSILTANTGAPHVLRDLRFQEELQPLYDFCQQFASLCEQVPLVDPEQISLKQGEFLWRQKADALHRDIQGWKTNAPARTTNYQRATSVWRRWQEVDGPIGQLMELLLIPHNSVSQADLQKVDKLKKQLDDKRRFEQLVHDTDRELPAQMSSKIEGRAIAQLRRYAQDAVELAQRWLTLHHQNPTKEQTDYIQQHILQLQQLFNKNKPLIAQALLALRQKEGSSLFADVGARYLERALERVEELFNGQADPATSSDPSLDLERTLNRPLLRIPDLHLNNDWQPVDATLKDVCRKILIAIKEGLQTFEEAFHGHLQNHDHIASYQVLQVLESLDPSNQRLLELERTRRNLMETDLARLLDELRRTENKLNRIVAYGLIGEEERAKFSATIDGINLLIRDLQTQDGLRFRPLFDILETTRATLTQYWDDEVQKVRARLNEVRAKKLTAENFKPSFIRIEALLDKGDPVTANDYIDLLERDDHLPNEQEELPFDHFFHRDFQTIQDLLSRPGSTPRIRRQLESGPFQIGSTNFEDFSPAQRRSAATLFRAWGRAKEQTAKNKDATEQIRIILTELGFTLKSLKYTPRSGRKSWYQVQAQPIRDQASGQLPSFGSKVAGYYSVLCVNEPAREEELTRYVGDQSHTTGVLVFYFGKMSQIDRRRLAHYKRESRHGRSASFLVLDDLLLLWLCAQQPRQTAFFQAASPFTNSRPFDVTASFVPPEMFYGRAREMEELIDPFGSCFIYGGRQLGKTALLRHIVRERHNPDDGFIVTWIDLKAQGLGYNQKTDHISRVIADTLKQEGVIPANVGSHAHAETIYRHILRWLDDDRQRRILLLLDETDRFLEIDASDDFQQCVLLKNIMEKSDRRFKVVFAGLHNVQRSTRQENQPLAHFGKAICIGPLWENGEWRQALNLIRTPFHTMGYRFESPDLPMRILAQTNFYPNLLQLYGDELLRHLHYEGKVSFDQATSPPYRIGSTHIEEAYQSQSLRDSIRDKFKLTLQLDQRYEVIAYIIAYEVKKQDVNAIVAGLTLSHIRDQAMSYWPEGFVNNKDDFSFRVLLEEMIGLGILREVSSRRYTLRNSNVILLLGSLEEILGELFRDREPPAEYEPASFRAARLIDPKGTTDFRRSPFTAEQESALRTREHGANIVIGHRAAGFDDLLPWLRSTFNDDLHILPEDSTKTDMEHQLQSIREARRGEGLEVLYIPPSSPWNADWVRDACAILARLQSRQSFVRVIFGADAPHYWKITEAHNPEHKLADLDAFDAIIAMEPWKDQALRRWCSDNQLGAAQDEQIKLSNRTGNWPAFLYRFYRLHKDQDNRQSIAESLQLFEDRFTTSQELRQWLDLLGVSGPIEEALRRLYDSLPSPFTSQELQDKKHTFQTPPERLLRWALAMNILIPFAPKKGAPIQYKFAPLVSDLLALSAPEEG